jgi:hypothetical protein
MEAPTLTLEAETARFSRRSAAVTLTAQLAFVVPLALFYVLVPGSDELLTPVLGRLLAAFFVVYVVILALALGTSRVQLRLERGLLKVIGRARQFPLAHAQLAEWIEWGVNTRKGAVLILSGGFLSNLRIGVFDVAFPLATGSNTAAVRSVDLQVSSEIFGTLLAQCSLATQPSASPAQASPATRWPIEPNRAAPLPALASLMGYVAFLIVAGSALALIGQGAVAAMSWDMSSPPAQLGFAVAIGIPLVAVPIWWFYRRSGRAIAVADGCVHLVDTRRERVLTTTPATPASIIRATYSPPWWWTRGGAWERRAAIMRYGSYSYAVIEFRCLDGRRLRVGVPDYSIGWAGGAVSAARAPQYWLGKGDWKELNDALGLHDLVVEKADRFLEMR